MAKAKDLTLEVLKGIREEMRLNREEVKQTNVRLDILTGRVDHLEDAVGKRIVDSEMRTTTAITSLVGAMTAVQDLLRGQLDLRPRMERVEREIDALKARLPDS